MDKTLYQKKIHEEILDIMDVVDRVCRKNRIHYYLISGTLLGAIRHGGFIPWDDDLDIVMPREDFNRFLDICKTRLPDGYKLNWITTEPEYWRIYAKISNTQTVFLEQGAQRNCGIFVDVFPIDDTNGYSRFVELRKQIIKKLAVMISGKRSPESFSGLKKYIVKFLTYKALFKIANFIMTMTNGNNRKYYSNFGSQYPIKRRTIEKEAFGNGCDIKFENRIYIAPDKSEAVLKNIFGNNYMELPPVEKRKTHYPAYVRFSDGTEALFADEKTKLSISDIL
jgi:lipopolysaccharide cholinephosphotransferase